MTWALLAVLAAAPVTDAQARYEAGDFEGALKLLDAAVRAGSATGPLHMTRARCLNALRRNAELDGAFEAALTADPAVTANDDDSPGFRATFERIRARLAGTLNVQSDPPGLAVRLDGAMVGRAPVSQLLPVGRYRVAILDASGAEADARDVVVAPRATQTVALRAKAEGVAAVAVPAQVEDPHWVVVPTFTARVLVDPRAGAGLEGGVGLLGKYVVAELDVVGGAVPGAGLRVGPRLAFVDGWVSAQATLDGVAFFAGGAVLGGGATLGFVVRPLAFLEVALEGSARVVQPPPGFHREYGLVALAVRLRWPNRLAE